MGPLAEELSGLAGAEIDGVLALTREVRELGEPETRVREPHPLDKLVTEAAALCAPLSASSEVRVVNGVVPLPAVLMDRRRLKRALTRLLEDAIRHSRPGGIVTVDAGGRVRRRRARIALSVSDSGRRDLRVSDVSALGLALAYRIIEEHGGSAVVERSPDGATVTTVRLPSAPMEPAGEV